MGLRVPHGSNYREELRASIGEAFDELEEKIIIMIRNIEDDNNQEADYTNQNILDDLYELLKHVERR